MANKKKKEPFCGDIVNSLAHECRDFQWSIVYKWYFDISQGDKLKKNSWMSGKVNIGCIPEAFDFKN
jgi:hypothetical protein